jgi:pyruvate/2-oxoglutarate dehydrogenase complex dihydrolipoamide acyltransferase (E2) component
MSTQILMPALSPTMEEGKLAKWHVKEGDAVKSGDILAEIETDKATMEFEAVDEGRIGKLLVPEGAEGVKVNAPIATLLGEGETAEPGTGADISSAMKAIRDAMVPGAPKPQAAPPRLHRPRKRHPLRRPRTAHGFSRRPWRVVSRRFQACGLSRCADQARAAASSKPTSKRRAKAALRAGHCTRRAGGLTPGAGISPVVDRAATRRAAVLGTATTTSFRSIVRRRSPAA